MENTKMTITPATGLALSVVGEPWVLGEKTRTAPDSAAQGTGLSFAGDAFGAVAAVAPVAVHTAQVAVLGARSTDLPGPVPRGAPV